ncbi:hypothetical protein [Cryobacterium zhongshanensis]|uniref:DNA-directed RNA polymerase n=1 Tax=Cryobacterium zhongshanensis TaxID=2928153 RepID=A0AA41R252_9MICO|nr:hypothetical protein [Cryobacterium zhongshanensis]MCI4659596.1 hypothetical protein [Cryobacterium zhongshanensis]
MRRYLYEHLFQQTIERTQDATGKIIMVSAARDLRAKVEQKLAAEGRSMADADLGIPPVLRAIESTMQENVTGYQGVFTDTSPTSPAYIQMKDKFFDMAGFARKSADGASVVQARTGAAGARLPISPYDPRWAVRSTVKQAGSRLTFVLGQDIEQYVGGNVSRIAELRTTDLHLYSIDEEAKLVEAGEAYSHDDASGMTELMGRMSEQEYRNVRDWVIDGARGQDGQLNPRAFMSDEALGRSAAILDELRAQGVGYTVRRDRNPGQIKVELEGTKISVRLTEPRHMEHFVGRVYDDGVSTHYSTNVKAADRSLKTVPYTPTAAEAVSLLRIAQGKPVERFDGKGLVGKVGAHAESEWNREQGRRVPIQVQDSYHTKNDRTSMSVMGDLVIDGKIPEPGAKVFVRRSAKARTATALFFLNAERGEAYLRESVDSARENLVASLDVERLVADHEAHVEEAKDGDWFPEFSGDAEVAAIQRSYWDVLRDAQTTLLRSGATEDEYQAKVGVIGELQVDTDVARVYHDMLVEDLAYVGSAEQKVHDHAGDVVDELIGSYDQHEQTLPDGEVVMRRFDPVRVAKHMTSEFGTWRNNADIVAALRVTGIDGDDLMGSSFYATAVKDRLVRFDEASAVEPSMHEDAFVSRMGSVIGYAIERNGGKVTSLLIDKNGIASWEADRYGRTGVAESVKGQIGQLFGRGEHGEVVTRFAGGENYLFAPGYEARIASQTAGDDLSVEERTLLRGYEQTMGDQVEYQIANDMLVMRTEVGEPTSLNSVYRRLYDVRHDVDFIDRSSDEGLDSQWVEAILSTESRRVRYPSEIASGSTVHAAWRAENSSLAADPANDNRFDPWILTGGRNMAIMTNQADGFFDPVMTNGAVYQGITRYLVEGASVDPATGKIIRSADLSDRAPLMKLPETEMMKYDPYDRQQMSASNLLNAAAVTEPVGVAMMTFGGWTADDPMVVSKNFAEKHAIRGANGSSRALVPGDKLSDMHGNKGVISLVVDRDAVIGEDFDAHDQSMNYAVQVFKMNPELDVVMSPFSAVSRFNGGTARELMQDPGDLALPWKGMTENTMGKMRLVVTHKDVERGTRVYDEAALREGRGRKASSQLAWALGSQGCDEVMSEFYGPNNSAVANFREMLVTMGLDLEADGTMRVGYDDMAEGSERRLFPMPELSFTSKGTLNAGKMKGDFGQLIGDRGGDLELPFPLRFPTGERIPTASDSTWKLPVMSSHLRSGQDLDDGQSTAHDYTNQYLAVYEMATRYRAAKEELTKNGEALTPKRRSDLEDMAAEAPRRAQAAFDTITDDLKQKRFSGKRNVFKEGLMSSRLPNSATAVWTSDPRLDIDQLAMGPAMAEALGLQDNDYALVWRDPVLRDAGVRYLRVKVDERLTGVAINPAMDKCFDGDFDGDSVAVVRLTSDGAREQALKKLSVEANLLDLGQFGEDSLHPLAMQDSLDVKVSQHIAPRLAEQFANLKMRANEVQSDLEDGAINDFEAWESRTELVGDLSNYYREAMEGQYGDAILRFGEAGDHVKSVIEACIDTEAKGSMAKIGDYCRHVGVDPVTMADLGDTQHTRLEDEGVMMATAVKSHGTGIAGTFSQRGVKALRNAELKAVLELTYPVTQSVLQAKHDPEEARQKYNMLMGPARSLWKGRKLEAIVGEDGERTWAVARDENSKEIQADVETWKRQFVELYTSKDGLNVTVNLRNVDKVAAALTGPTGLIIDIEDPQDASLDTMGSTMDRLAYGGTFDDVLAAATTRENIFAGSENGHFAPYAVRSNQHAIAEWEKATEAGLDVEAPEVKLLVNRDVLAESDTRARARGEGRKSPVAATVRAPRPRPAFVEVPDDAADAELVDDYQL